jgi:hypothetical protein
MRGIIGTLPLCIAISLSAGAAAQSKRPDLSSLPEVIKSLKWKEIDVAALTPIERCRSLQLLNGVLEEIGSAARAEADLMSEFLEKQDLGKDYASDSTPPVAGPLVYADGTKIAVAMLRGPLAQSSYATALSDVSDARLIESYVQLYDATAQRKWSEAVEARQQVRSMSHFLHVRNKVKDYETWVPSEVQRREQAFENEMAQRRAAARAKSEAKNQQEAAAAQERQQQAAQQEQERQAAQMQQALAAAQQNQTQSQQNGVTGDDDDWYPGWYYGAVSNLGRTGWYRDASYRGAAGARVEGRISGWHGGGRRR